MTQYCQHIRTARVNTYQNAIDMIFNSENFSIKEQENLNNILSFQKETNFLLPPSLLYILVNFGEIKYNFKVKHYYSDEHYQDILLDTIPSISTLNLWLENYWKNLMEENKNLRSNYLPMLNTYAPNITFLVGVQESNLDRIFLYDDDYENFKPILLSTNIFDFFKSKIKSIS